MYDGFIYTSEEDAIKIAKHLKGGYCGLSRVTGNPVLHITNTSYWNFYQKYIKSEFVQTIDDTHSLTFVIKILEHNPKLFEISLREEKLKRILNEKNMVSQKLLEL